MKKLWAWILVVFMVAGTCMPVNAAEINGVPVAADQETISLSEKESDAVQKEEAAAAEEEKEVAAEAEEKKQEELTEAENTISEENVIMEKERQQGKTEQREAVEEISADKKSVSTDSFSGSERSSYKLLVDPSEITLKEGESFKLSYSWQDGNEPDGVTGYDFTVRGPNVISLDEETMTVTALGEGGGEVSIDAKAGNTTYNATCKVTVQKTEAETVISINGTAYAVAGAEGKSAMQAAFEKSGLGARDITSISFNSGVIRSDDFDTISDIRNDGMKYSLTSFSISDAVEVKGTSDSEIPINTFYDCTSLTTVYLGSSVKAIGFQAFKSCPITDLKAPAVQKLGKYSLQKVQVPVLNLPSVVEIGYDNPFDKTNSATTEIILPSLRKVSNRDFLSDFKNLRKLTLGENPPEMTGNLKFYKGVADQLQLIIPEGALANYQADKNYDAQTNTWSGIKLPYVVTVNVDGQETVIEIPAGNTGLGSLMPAEPEKKGFTFKEWNTQADGKGTVITADTPITANMTIYAIFEEIRYNLAVDPAVLTLKEGETAVISHSMKPEEPEGVTYKYQAIGTGNVAFDESTMTVTAVGAGTNGGVRITATWKNAAGNTTSTSRTVDIIVEKAETESVISINGIDYEVPSVKEKSGLEQAVEKSGLAISDITSIEYKSGVIRSDDFKYLSDNKKTICSGFTAFIIGDEVEVRGVEGSAIPYDQFDAGYPGFSDLTTVYLGKNIKGLEKDAFNYCGGIVSFEAPAVEYIESGALSRIKVKTLNLPSVREIQENAFGTLKTIEEASFPSLQKIAYDALENFTGLKKLELGENPPAMTKALKLPKGIADNLELVLPRGAVKNYQTGEYYDQEKNTWCGIKLGAERPYVVNVVVDGHTTMIEVPYENTGMGNLMPADPEKKGFIFLGWNTKDDGSGNTVTSDTPITDDITIYGVFREEYIYKVTFKADGKETVVNVRETVGRVALPEDPQKEGYIFLGWNTRADGKGAAVTADTSVAGDMTVYGIFREEYIYYVTFVVDGEKTVVKVKETDGKLNLPKSPEKEGYRFVGWNTRADGKGIKVEQNMKITGDMTVYAVFAKKAESTDKIAAVQTGDTANMIPGVTVLLISGCVIAVLLFRKRRMQK